MIHTQVNNDLNFFIFDLPQSDNIVSYVPSLNRLKRDKTVMLNGSVCNVSAIFICECMSHKQVIPLFKP